MSYNSTFANAISLSAAARVAYNTITSKMPLAPWFPAHTNPGLDFAFDRRVASGADVAEFRDFDAENTLGQTFGNARLSGTLPPIGRNYRLLEYEQAQFYNEGKKNAATAQYLMERVGDGARAIARRLEQNTADQALLNQLIAKRDERKVTKLSAIEQQIAKLKAEAAALVGETPVAAEPEVAEV